MQAGLAVVHVASPRHAPVSAAGGSGGQGRLAGQGQRAAGGGALACPSSGVHDAGGVLHGTSRRAYAPTTDQARRRGELTCSQTALPRRSGQRPVPWLHRMLPPAHPCMWLPQLRPRASLSAAAGLVVACCHRRRRQRRLLWGCRRRCREPPALLVPGHRHCPVQLPEPAHENGQPAQVGVSSIHRPNPSRPVSCRTPPPPTTAAGLTCAAAALTVGAPTALEAAPTSSSASRSGPATGRKPRGPIRNSCRLGPVPSTKHGAR